MAFGSTCTWLHMVFHWAPTMRAMCVSYCSLPFFVSQSGSVIVRDRALLAAEVVPGTVSGSGLTIGGTVSDSGLTIGGTVSGSAACCSFSGKVNAPLEIQALATPAR
jgi:hypothetical protein